MVYAGVQLPLIYLWERQNYVLDKNDNSKKFMKNIFADNDHVMRGMEDNI